MRLGNSQLLASLKYCSRGFTNVTFMIRLAIRRSCYDSIHVLFVLLKFSHAFHRDTTMSESSKPLLLHASRKRSRDVGCSTDAGVSLEDTPPCNDSNFPTRFHSVPSRSVPRRPSVQPAGIVHVELL